MNIPSPANRHVNEQRELVDLSPLVLNHVIEQRKPNDILLPAFRHANGQREAKIVKILGLHVCGIQSKLKLGTLEQYVQDCDFVCLSEAKTSKVDDNCIPGYHPIVLSKKHGSHKLGGIHGLCIFVKKTYIDNVSIITDTKSDCILWLEVSKPIFGEEIVIGAVYLPHEGSQFHNDDIFNDLAEDIQNLKISVLKM